MALEHGRINSAAAGVFGQPPDAEPARDPRHDAQRPVQTRLQDIDWCDPVVQPRPYDKTIAVGVTHVEHSHS